MKDNALVTGMLSGLVSGVLVALVSAFTISASIDTNDIALPDLGGSNDEQVFVAPFSGEAILIAEFETTGKFLWGSIAVVSESEHEHYALTWQDGGKGLNPLNFDEKKVRSLKYPQISKNGKRLSANYIKTDQNVLCHQVDVGVRVYLIENSDDHVRPARINLNCPIMEFKQGERYAIKTDIGDKGGGIDRFDGYIRYIYRRPRLW